MPEDTKQNPEDTKQNVVKDTVIDAAKELVQAYCKAREKQPLCLLGVSPPWETDSQPHLQDFGKFALTELKAGDDITCFLLGDLDGYASWLFKSDKEKYRVLIDTPHILGRRNWPDHAQDLLLSRIYLHELAHVVLHRKYVFQHGAGKGRNCRPDHEDEAWRFVAAVVGLALGSYAKSCKENGREDLAWLYA